MSASDYDGGWKYVTDTFLAELLDYVFPELHARVNWSSDPQVLDGELAEFSIEPLATLRSDRLILLRSNAPTPQPFLLHIEFQSQRDSTFTRRMARYAARIAERYDLPLALLAILADQNPHWRPPPFDGGFAGIGMLVTFQTYKLIDRPLEDVVADPRFAALFDLMLRLSW